ncbi:hypothetical protein INT48_000753, partial [Thamnidium elegans]
HIPESVVTNNDSDDDDMFGDDIAFEELEGLSALMTEPSPTDASELFGEDIPAEELGEVLGSIETGSTKCLDNVKREKFIRYIVASVTEGKYFKNGEEYTECVVLLIQEDEDRVTKARIREEWRHTIIQVGDVVHIPFITYTPDIIIDDLNNFIVVHPDRLISCTSVADSYVCTRKSVLQLKVRPISEYTEALVHGNIIHSVLQKALETEDFKIESIEQEIEHVVMTRLSDLYAMDQDEETALKILNEYAPGISRFGSTFVSKSPRPSGYVNTDIGIDPTELMGFETISISDVLDIEEHFWSPSFGLKGMIDATVEMTMSKNNKVITVPFELKTGKTARFLTNRAQTLLYTLLMSDRYDIDINAGLLYYSKTNSIYVIPSSRNDLRSLIISRNTLASAFNKKDYIPPMIRDSHTCQYCFVNTTCTLYHKAVEKGTGSTSGLFNLFDDKTDHMSENACRFFERWWNLLDKEEVDLDYIRKNIWSQPAEIREQTGKCLANMALNLSSCEIEPAISRWQYSFIRHPSQPNKPLLCSISIGDPIVVSSMQGHINLSMGFVTRISTEEITVDLTEPLRTPPEKGDQFDPTSKQNFSSFIRSAFSTKDFYTRNDTMYRIDRDEMMIGMGMLRNNLVLMTEKDALGESKKGRLRDLVIDLAKPDFNPEPLDLPPTPNMNSDQRKALKRVIQAKDYTLILGMPGTGKTTTTAEIIKFLVSRGKTVLLTAYTHTALDNVLCKVRENGLDVLRLGNVQKVMPSLRDCVPANNTTIKSVGAMQDFYNSKRVVGVTCLGIGDVLLQKREFDYCIVDEASQITLPTCIGPIRYAKKFVLVGDLYQLPPIVRNKSATDGGLDKSLFSILAEAQPDSICYLEFQYRMNRDIMDISNHLVYGRKLKCGTYQTATRRLELPEMDLGMKLLHQNENQICEGRSNCWIKNLLDPNRKVIFVNIDALDGKESRPFEGFLQNDIEAALIEQTVESLIASGVAEEQLALISVYRSQLRIISQVLKARQGIEIATIDKYQGRDKDCVIISLVRNNEAGNVGDLLRDWRRINVAVTRAKSKLIMFGSVTTLKSTALYCTLLNYLEEKGWILNLEKNAEVAHNISSDKIKMEAPIKGKLKTVSSINAVLKKNRILKDIYQNTF